MASLLVASAAVAQPQQSVHQPSLLSAFSAWQDGDITTFVEEVPTPDSVYSMDACHFKKYSSADDLDDTVVIIDEIVNLGEKVWSIIEKGKPVLNSQYVYSNALPQGVKSASDLDQFSPIQAKSFRVYGKNGFGITVYDLTYTLVHRFGGNYLGKGKYLDNVTVLPQDVSVLWGYDVDLGVTGVSTVNIGTHEAPVAGLTMELTMKVSTVLKASEMRGLYDFHGDTADVLAVQ